MYYWTDRLINLIIVIMTLWIHLCYCIASCYEPAEAIPEQGGSAQSWFLNHLPLLQHALHGEVPLKNIWKHQMMQNSVTAGVMGSCNSARVTLLLNKLYWLPICFLVQFKVPVFTFKALHCLGLGYLQDCYI